MSTIGPVLLPKPCTQGWEHYPHEIRALLKNRQVLVTVCPGYTHTPMEVPHVEEEEQDTATG